MSPKASRDVSSYQPRAPKPKTRWGETWRVSRGLSRDTELLIAAQAVRGLGYGFTAVVLGSLLAAKGVSPVRAGVLLATLIGGSALSSLAVGADGDPFGRRRSYGLFFVGVGPAGAVVATNPPLWLLFVVAVIGTLFTDVVDNGAATTLEQVKLAAEDAGTGRVYGWYNAGGAAFGALGALGAALVGMTRSGTGAHAWLFVALVPVGLAGATCAVGLSEAVEASREGSTTNADTRRERTKLGPSGGVVSRLAALFSVDAAGGGLVTTAFLSYYLAERHGVSLAALGWLFFAVSAMQAVSVANSAADRPEDRAGAHHGWDSPTEQCVVGVDRLRTYIPRGGHLVVGPHHAFADGRAYSPGLGHDGDHTTRAHGGGGDQRRSLLSPAICATARRCLATGQPGNTVARCRGHQGRL